MQVFDHQDDLLSQPIDGFQGGSASALFQLLPAPPGRQIGVCVPELFRTFGIALANLPCEVEQRFEPEVAHVEDFLAFFHEPDRQQPFGELLVGAQLRGNARQQHGFPAPARRHEQDVLARRRPDVSTEDFEHDAELASSDRELPDHFIIGLEDSRVEFAERRFRRYVHRTTPRPGSEKRLSRDVWWSRKRAAHQSFSSRDGKR